jgi:hypothetical protein
VFDRFYEKATSWLYEYDPGRLPSGDERNRMARRAS